MIYTERKNLTVLELREEQDSLSFHEMIALLRERPSHAIYIELHGILYGMVTIGSIHRALSNKICQVEINKQFIAVDTEKSAYMRSRRLFEERATIHFVPVTDTKGKLLGEWSEEKDLPAMSYILSAANYLDVAEGLNGRKPVLVRPLPAFENKRKVVSAWKRLFEGKGVFPEVVDWEK